MNELKNYTTNKKCPVCGSFLKILDNARKGNKLKFAICCDNPKCYFIFRSKKMFSHPIRAFEFLENYLK